MIKLDPFFDSSVSSLDLLHSPLLVCPLDLYPPDILSMISEPLLLYADDRARPAYSEPAEDRLHIVLKGLPMLVQ